MTEKFDRYEGRLVLITGGSSGMGLALAQLLAAEGARVWLLARHKQKLEAALRSLPARHGQTHGMITADVTSWDRVHAAVRRIREAAGVPDVLINAAGAAHPAYLQDTTLEIFREMMDLNYFGTVHMVKALAAGHDRARQRLHRELLLGRRASWRRSATPRTSHPSTRCGAFPIQPAARAQAHGHPRLHGLSAGYGHARAWRTRTRPSRTRRWRPSAASCCRPSKVAAGSPAGHETRQVHILPGGEISLYYRLTFWLGDAIYPLMDYLLAQARRKKARLERG